MSEPTTDEQVTLHIISVLGTGDPFDMLTLIPFTGGHHCMGEEWAERFGIPLPERHHAIVSRMWNVGEGPHNSSGSIVFCEPCHEAFYPCKAARAGREESK